jgi:CRISPR locus-related DNA-binding protein
LQQESSTRTLVFTLGFDVTAIIARLSEAILTGREHLIFIVPETPSPRAVATQKSIESHLAVLNTRGFSLSSEFLRVKEGDLSNAIAQTLEALDKHERILVELSGGLRYLILATYVASCLLKDKVEMLSTRLETDGSQVTIPLMESDKLSPADFRLLQDLRSLGRATQRELVSVVGRRISSVSRIVARLQRRGLVEVSGSHPRIYALSSLGEVFLKFLAKRAKE